MKLAQRLVGLTMLVLTIAVIGFTNVPRNLGKDAVWGARHSAQRLHLVGGTQLPQGAELHIRHVALDGTAHNQLVNVPAGQGRDLAALGVTLPPAPADTVTEISLYAAGKELFRSVPVISGTKDIYLQPVALLGVLNNPFVCTSAQGEENLSLLVDPRNHAVALHLLAKGDGTDLPSLYAVSATQWQSDDGQVLTIDPAGNLIVQDQGSQIDCTADPMWGNALPVRLQTDGQYFYADAQSVVFFDGTAKPASLAVEHSLTETSWNAKESKLTMLAGNETAFSTVTFGFEDCTMGNTWGLHSLKVVHQGPGGLTTQTCSGQELNPVVGTWAAIAMKGQPKETRVELTLTPSGFYLEGQCAVYSGRLVLPVAPPFASAALQFVDRRTKQTCGQADSDLDAALTRAFAKELRLEPLGGQMVLRAADASGIAPDLKFSRSQNLGT